jgi:hypothetical protein
LPPRPRQVLERLLEFVRNLDGWQIGRVGHGYPLTRLHCAFIARMTSERRGAGSSVRYPTQAER